MFKKYALMQIDVFLVFYVTQYDDFEDSDGVTSEGKDLHTSLDMLTLLSFY